MTNKFYLQWEGKELKFALKMAQVILIFHFLMGEISYTVTLAKIEFPFPFATHTLCLLFYSTSHFFPYFLLYYFLNYFLLICHTFCLFILFITYCLSSYLEYKLQVQGSLSVLLIDAFQISRRFLTHHNHLINIY